MYFREMALKPITNKKIANIIEKALRPTKKKGKVINIGFSF